MLEYFYQKPVKILTANTVKSRIMDLSKKGIEDTRKMIKVHLFSYFSTPQGYRTYIRHQNIPGMVSLSLDAWTSSNDFAFLAIVMHYVDENWELRS